MIATKPDTRHPVASDACLQFGARRLALSISAFRLLSLTRVCRRRAAPQIADRKQASSYAIDNVPLAIELSGRTAASESVTDKRLVRQSL
ncbi:MAG: hypothetical protein ACRYG4_25810 [Janthinobacterium lividum]